MKAARFGLALAAGLLACRGAQVRPDAKLMTTTAAQPAAKAAPVATPAQPIVPKDEDARTLLAEAKADFAAGKFADAKAAFEKLVNKQPHDAGLQFDLGLVEEKLGDSAAALKAYEAAHRRAPEDVSSALNLARLYREDGRLADAIAVYQQALAAEKNAYDARLLDSLSDAFRLKKEFAKAEAAAKKSLSRNKDDVEAYKGLALIYFDQGNYRLAELLCANAKKVAPKDPGIFNDLGLIYLKQEETALALDEFEKATALDPNFEPGYANIGAVALRYRDYPGAERAFSKAAALAPKRAELHLDLAYALDGQRPVNSAKGLAAAAEFEKVLALQPSSSEAICGAGWAFTADRAGFAKAASYLAKCRALTTGEAERARIDAKLQALAVMMPKAPAPAAQTPGPADDKTGIGGAGGSGKPAPNVKPADSAHPAGEPGAQSGVNVKPSSVDAARNPTGSGAADEVPTAQASGTATPAAKPAGAPNTNVSGTPKPSAISTAPDVPGAPGASAAPSGSELHSARAATLPARSDASHTANTTGGASGSSAGVIPAQPEAAQAGQAAGTR